MADQQVLQVRVAVGFSRSMMLVRRVDGGKTLDPLHDIVPQSRLVIVDEDAGGDVHGAHEHDAVAYAALIDEGFNAVGDVDQLSLLRRVHRQIVGSNPHVRPRTPSARAPRTSADLLSTARRRPPPLPSGDESIMLGLVAALKPLGILGLRVEHGNLDHGLSPAGTECYASGTWTTRRSGMPPVEISLAWFRERWPASDAMDAAIVCSSSKCSSAMR